MLATRKRETEIRGFRITLDGKDRMEIGSKVSRKLVLENFRIQISKQLSPLNLVS